LATARAQMPAAINQYLLPAPTALAAASGRHY